MLARGDDGSFLHRAALDALIQLNTVVKAEKLLLHFERFPNQVVILLALDPIGNEQTFLSLLDLRQSNEPWLALCNLLVRLRSKGLASRLLSELYISVSIVVAEKWNHERGGGPGAFSCDPAIIAVPPGLPPIVEYGITDIEQKGAVVLAVGRHNVYSLRNEQQGDVAYIGGGGCLPYEKIARYRVAYLSELLGTTPKKLNFPATPSYRIVWNGAQDYRRDVFRIRREIRKSYGHLLNRLIEAKMLTRQEADSLSPKIGLQINDIRKDQSISLPKI